MHDTTVSPDVIPTEDVATDVPSSPLCDRLAAHAQRCGATACDIDALRRNCARDLSHFRMDFENAYVACVEALDCSADASASACITSVAQTFTPTMQARDAVRSYCTACPQDDAGVDACVNNAFDTDAGPGIGTLLTILNDTALRSLAQCIGNGTDGGISCSAATSCLAAALDVHQDMCTDAGR
jgi:hypothetical protein